MEYPDETGCWTLPVEDGEAVPTRAASGAAAASEIWVDASWRAGPCGEIPVLLIDLERRAVLLTRSLHLPRHLPLLADSERQDILRKRLEQATGYPVRALRLLCRMDVGAGAPGVCTYALQAFCAGPVRDPVDGLLLLDLDQAVTLADARVLDDAVTESLVRHAHRQLLPLRPMMILVAGPWRSPGGAPRLTAGDVAAMEACVQPLYDAGHLPVLGEWLTAPTMHLAGTRVAGDDAADAVAHAHRVLAACDAVLRVGARLEADPVVVAARRLGKRVFDALEEVPGLRPRLVEDHPLFWM